MCNIMDNSKHVLFSQPVLFPRNFPLPSNFHLVAKEDQLSWNFAKKLPSRVSDRLVRIYLIYEILRNRKKIDMVITGRYGEYFALLQGLIPLFKKSHLLLDIEWYGNRKNKYLNSFKKVIHRIIARGAHKIGVFCES